MKISSLENKKAYVTGGARGIGKAVALGMAEAGADVAIVDLDLPEAELVAAEIKGMGRKSIAVQCDVTSQESVQQMVKTVAAELGRIDIAFNNAGICINEKAEDMSYAAWKKVMDINLDGVFLCCREAGRQMMKQGGGSIINTASMSGHIVNYPQPQCAYNASKAGVIHLTKSLAVEWARHNIRVNCISPGYIGTEMTLAAPEEWKSKWTELTMAGRMGTPEELIGGVIYLAGDAASFTTGTDLVIDGAYCCV